MTLTFRVITSATVDFLQDLCNDLMSYQASLARIRKDIMQSMNYHNRLKPDYESAKRKFMIVAYDGVTPIGFAFATISDVIENNPTVKPGWAEDLDGLGFYPEDYKVPKKIGTFKLLYVDNKYRGYKIGQTLTKKVMNWFSENKDINDLWVYVANGNEVVGEFYHKFGFQYSHSVYNGFVDAHIMNIR